MWKWRSCLFVQLRSRRAEEGYSKCRQVLIWFAFYYWLFPREHRSSSSSPLLSSVSLRLIYFVIFSQKHDSQNATELPAFKPAALSSFSIKYGWHRIQKSFVRFTNRIWLWLQAGTFRALEPRKTQVFSNFPPFCSKKMKTSCVCMTKISNVKNYG